MFWSKFSTSKLQHDLEDVQLQKELTSDECNAELSNSDSPSDSSSDSSDSSSGQEITNPFLAKKSNDGVAYDEFDATFKAIPQSDKWVLSTGKRVEDALYHYGMQCSHEHLCHSFIIDPYDENYLKNNVFTMNELKEIQSFNKKPMPLMPTDLLKYLNSFRAPETSGSIVNLSARLLNLLNIGNSGTKPAVSWGSKVGSVISSVSGLSDIKNMENTVTEETNYADLVASEHGESEDETMPRKTHTRMYVLGHLPKVPTFDNMSDDDDVLMLFSPKFASFVLLIESCAVDTRSFRPVKSFTLDIELSVVPEKTNGDKLFAVKKIFYKIDGFGGASTPSKFPGIIRLSFTSESSLNKAKLLAVSENILVNDDHRKVNSHSDQEIIVKEIPIDLPKSAIIAVFSKFGKIISIKMQLIGLWQKALVEYESSKLADLVAARWSVLVRKDSVRVALLYTLPIGTTAHDLSGLLDLYNGKTCFIGHNPGLYVHNRCAIICFKNKTARLAAVSTVPIFKGVGLHWASLVLASCAKCDQFGHIHADCSVGESYGVCGKRVVSDQDWVHLAGIYKKKLALIARPVSFGGKTWAQVASSTLSHAFFSGSGLHSGLVLPSVVSDPLVVSCLSDCLVILERSLKLLADHVSGILVRLNSFGVVPLVPSFLVSPPIASAVLDSEMDSDMIVDNALSSSDITPPVTDDTVVNLNTSGSKVLTAKIGSLEMKLVALKALVGSILDKLNLLCSVWKIATCNVRGMNNCAKQADIVRWHKNMNNLVSIVTETKLKGKIHPWIADRFDGICVFTSGLNSNHMGSGVAIILNSLLVRHVCKILEVPGQLLSVRLLFKNKLSVSILRLYAGASSVVCFSQAGNINSFIAKAMNEFSFVILDGDFNEDGSHKCASFNKCFDLGLVNSLGGSLFVKSLTWCNSCGVAKTINYVFVSSNLINVVVDRSVASVDDFFDTDHKAVSVSVGISGLLDVQLSSLHKQANRNHWKFDIKCASEIDSSGASVVRSLFLSGSGFSLIHSVLVKARKLYCASKLLESKHAEESLIKQAISKRMESFELNKDHTIRSVLKHPFCKVVLNYLIVRDKLVLEPDSVKSKVDEIIEGWTKKHRVVSDISGDWVHQYRPLEHVFDSAFSGVMCPISFDKMSTVIKNFLDEKTAGLSGISNELWKCYDKSVLDMLLVLLNLCLVSESIPGPWREAWISMIPKPYEWEEVLMNTCPIALIETAHKILSKILLDRISSACSTFNVLCRDNFSVLKSTTMQSPIFAVGSVIEDALEKNQEL
ncbi:hypothetical protein G9A89_014398 [Geosiphon pyriformis]|nr:hypothetical protein G9A89_014398 [Geosiphon pyriformis]